MRLQVSISVLVLGLCPPAAAEARKPIEGPQCVITGFAKSGARRPYYVAGETLRRHDQSNEIIFPIAALDFDEAQQRFSVPAPAAWQNLVEVQLRKTQVTFEGAGCPGTAIAEKTRRCRNVRIMGQPGSNAEEDCE